jgi:hypothetical protein
MRNAHGVIAVCFVASLWAAAQDKASTRKIVLPSPQLIHCHSAECSQLWKQDSGDPRAIYPAQIFTDLVKGEIVGLTAVYDKSVSQDEIRAAINEIYGKFSLLRGGPMWVWRIESEEIAVSMYAGNGGATQVTYLKFGTPQSVVPSAHIDCKN